MLLAMLLPALLWAAPPSQAQESPPATPTATPAGRAPDACEPNDTLVAPCALPAEVEHADLNVVDGSVDVYSLFFKAGRVYAITAASSSGIDPALRVFLAGQLDAPIAENDDAAPGSGTAVVQVAVPNDGWYLVEVTNRAPGDMRGRSYTLSARSSAAPAAPAPSAPGDMLGYGTIAITPRGSAGVCPTICRWPALIRSRMPARPAITISCCCRPNAACRWWWPLMILAPAPTPALCCTSPARCRPALCPAGRRSPATMILRQAARCAAGCCPNARLGWRRAAGGGGGERLAPAGGAGSARPGRPLPPDRGRPRSAGRAGGAECAGRSGLLLRARQGASAIVPPRRARLRSRQLRPCPARAASRRLRPAAPRPTPRRSSKSMHQRAWPWSR
ncbi:MAG: hypothetical protein U0Z44_05850 [Kouleothrix sp.]